MNQHTNNQVREIEITTDDLPLHCPTPSMQFMGYASACFSTH